MYMQGQTEALFEKSYRSVKNLFGSSEIIFLPNQEGTTESYIYEMAKAIQAEVEDRGHCWLLDVALAERQMRRWDCRAFEKACAPYVQMPAQYAVSADRQNVIVTAELERCIVRFYSESKGAERGRYLKELEAQIADKKRLLQEYSQALDAKQNALKEIEEKRASAEAQAEEILSSARQEAAQLRQRMLHAIAAEQNASTDAQASELGQSVRDMEAKARGVENGIREVFEDHGQRLMAYANQIADYREAIEKMLYDFRVGLYSAEYGKLADAYQRLYLFATSVMDMRIQRLKKAGLDGEAMDLVETGLREIQALLIKRIGGIEEGMQRMGLTLIRPGAGDAYNCNKHAAENVEDDGTLSGTVRQCICPGVKYSNRVLCRAGVEVDVPGGNT